MTGYPRDLLSLGLMGLVAVGAGCIPEVGPPMTGEVATAPATI
jgi:hypothetical protein